MSPMLWAALVPACFVVGWLFARRPVREAFEDLNLDRAREQFRLQREGLEARFTSSCRPARPGREAALGRCRVAQRGRLGA